MAWNFDDYPLNEQMPYKIAECLISASASGLDAKRSYAVKPQHLAPPIQLIDPANEK